MARIRTVKPEFFTSEDIVSLSPLARLLYIALWCEADREGRMVWKPRTFKLRYLPADICDAMTLCDELLAAGVVRLYGDGLACIPAFSDHQNINPRESASTLPSPDASPRVRTRRNASNLDMHAQVGREGKEQEQHQDQEQDQDQEHARSASHSALADELPAVITIPLNNGDEHPITASQCREFADLYPAVDVPQQLRSLRAWSITNPTKRKTKGGILRFVNAWLARAQDQGGGLMQPRAGPPQAQSKTLTAIQNLEVLKNGLAEKRIADRIPEAALLGP